MNTLTTLRMLAEPARIRLLHLLSQEELSVADLQEILGMGQSRISMHLSQLRQSGLVEVRKSGQKSLYHISPAVDDLVEQALGAAIPEIPEAERDAKALELVLNRRRDGLREYFDSLAGRFGRNYVPGRSWRALSELLMRLLPPMDVADFGAGEGTIALMLARRARQVIAVDSSEGMVAYGSDLANRHGIDNLEYRLGDMEAVPIESGSMDMVMLHQSLHHALHPDRAVAEAFRVLRPGGRVVILDLLTHDEEAVKELYADVWLGFSQVELDTILHGAGFAEVEVGVVDRAAEAPHFETIMAIGVKG